MAHDTTPTSRGVSVPELSDAGLAVGSGDSRRPEVDINTATKARHGHSRYGGHECRPYSLKTGQFHYFAVAELKTTLRLDVNPE